MTCPTRPFYQSLILAGAMLACTAAAALGQAPVQTTVEQARRDIELLTSAFRKAIA